MSDNLHVSISLEEAKRLVACLEQGDNEGANEILDALATQGSIHLFEEVGKLTRQLHDALNNFQLDERIVGFANDEMPDARTRLTYVIEETEKAANITMDAVEKCMPIAETLSERIDQITPEWKKLMHRQIELGEFKTLCLQIDELLSEATQESSEVSKLLTDVLMAQGYQDLTGQVIRRVIELVKEVEDSLVNMLTMFGEHAAEKEKKPAKASGSEHHAIAAEGPIIDKQGRDDVVQNQDDVDDLLSSLGF